jgi:hypothetical protein
MLASTGAGFSKVTPLLPVALASAELTARTVIVFGLGSVFGAVYMPDELIVPAAALPPVTPFTCQVTEVFVVPKIWALNDCVAPARTFAVVGETVSVTPVPEEGALELEGDELFVVPVQPDRTAANSRDTKSDER